MCFVTFMWLDFRGSDVVVVVGGCRRPRQRTFLLEGVQDVGVEL